MFIKQQEVVSLVLNQGGQIQVFQSKERLKPMSYGRRVQYPIMDLGFMIIMLKSTEYQLTVQVETLVLD